jgi:hypothetical protein
MESMGEEHSDIYYEDDDASCPSLDELKHHREHRNKKYEATIQIGWLGNKQGSKSTGPDDSRIGVVTLSTSNGRILNNTCGMETITEHSTRGCLPQLNNVEEVTLYESNPVQIGWLGNKDLKVTGSDDRGISCPSLDEMKHHREHRKRESTTQIGWLGNKKDPDDCKIGKSSNSRIINTCGKETTTEQTTRGCLPQLNGAEKVSLSESNPVRPKKHIVDVQDDGNDNVEKILVVDDSSFLASANIEDATINESQLKESSNRDQYVFGFTLLTTNKNGETVEELPDDSSFIVGAAVVEDVVLLNNNDNESIGQGCNDVSSQYDVHASTLSRATASTRASIMKKKSNSISNNTHDNVIAEVGDEKSTSTYSYGQAYYGDNTTLTSKFTSTLSALTDDTNLRQVIKRTGMSSPVNFRTINERDSSSHYLPSKLGPSFDSGDITTPCRGGANKKSLSNNMACCVSSDETSDFTTSNETPSRQVSGYVDEEAARDWHKSSSSSRSCKLAVMFSILFLLLCGAGVAIALLLFREKDTNTLNESASSLYNECATGIPCYEETLGCNDGTIESCCGETFYSYVCDCIDFNSNLLYANCRYTEVCIDPSCE